LAGQVLLSFPFCYLFFEYSKKTKNEQASVTFLKRRAPLAYQTNQLRKHHHKHAPLRRGVCLTRILTSSAGMTRGKEGCFIMQGNIIFLLQKHITPPTLGEFTYPAMRFALDGMAGVK
jgi:hypothetical protein